MKKLLVISSLVVSMSVIAPVHAELFSSGAATAGAAEVAAEGAAIAIGAGAATAVTAGVAAGFGTAVVMNERLFTSSNLCTANQKSCKAAQVGTYTGAGLGSAGVLAAMATCGADIAGLTALGGTIGGGLLTGIATVVIAPVAIAAAGGYAAYYWWPTSWNFGGSDAAPAAPAAP
jgi:hypothetical protein